MGILTKLTEVAEVSIYFKKSSKIILFCMFIFCFGCDNKSNLPQNVDDWNKHTLSIVKEKIESKKSNRFALFFPNQIKKMEWREQLLETVDDSLFNGKKFSIIEKHAKGYHKYVIYFCSHKIKSCTRYGLNVDNTVVQEPPDTGFNHYEYYKEDLVFDEKEFSVNLRDTLMPQSCFIVTDMFKTNSGHNFDIKQIIIR